MVSLSWNSMNSLLFARISSYRSVADAAMAVVLPAAMEKTVAVSSSVAANRLILIVLLPPSFCTIIIQYVRISNNNISATRNESIVSAIASFVG